MKTILHQSARWERRAADVLAPGVGLALAVAMATSLAANAAEVWDGPAITFSQPPGADWTQPVNQDRMTPNVWITRATSQGLFNAVSESSYTHLFSPADTEWAYGTLDSYSSLTYDTWEAWNGRSPPSMVGRPAVLHLVSEDIYLGIEFTSWGGFGGGFSYERTTLVPEPSTVLVILLGLGIILAVRFMGRRVRH